MSDGVNVEISSPDGTRFTLRNKNLPWVRDVYPASGGWTVRVLRDRSDRSREDRDAPRWKAGRSR